MVAHHIADGLGFEDFELATEREKERNEFVVRDNVDGYAILLIVVMLRGVKRFVLYIRIAVGGDAHNDMLDTFILGDGDTDDVFEILIEIQFFRFRLVLTQHRRYSLNAVKGKIGNSVELRIPTEQEPSVVILLQVVRVYLASYRFVLLEGLITDIEHLLVNDGIKERRDVLQSFEIHVLLNSSRTHVERNILENSDESTTNTTNLKHQQIH